MSGAPCLGIRISELRRTRCPSEAHGSGLRIRVNDDNHSDLAVKTQLHKQRTTNESCL